MNMDMLFSSRFLQALVVLGHGVDIETAAKRLPCLSDFLKGKPRSDSIVFGM